MIQVEKAYDTFLISPNMLMNQAGWNQFHFPDKDKTSAIHSPDDNALSSISLMNAY